MDAKVVEILSKGLQACKRKGTASGETSKKAKMDVPSSVVPANVDFTIGTAVVAEVASTIKVPPMVEAPPTVEVARSSVLSCPFVKAQILEGPSQGEKGAEKKRAKGAVRKSRCKVRHDGPNSSDEELGENHFHNHEIVRDLIDGSTIPKVVDRIIDVDVDQRT
ncbi:putative ensconsin-like [Cocos nucifera]|nr:putative ensconsin-like [Cocos nucifera]